MLLKKILICLFSVSCIFANLQAQKYVTKKTAPKKALKYYDQGVGSIDLGDIKTAITHFKRAIKVEPTFVEAWSRLADCQRELGNLDLAESSFLKAYSLCPTCENNTLLSLSKIYWKKDSLLEAAKWAKAYLQSPAKSEFLRLEAEQIHRNALFSLESIKKPLPFRPKHLGNLVNTKDPEYLPMIFTDDTTLVFIRKIDNKQEDFFYTVRKDSVWQAPQPIKELNTSDNEGASCISGDGKTIIFSAREKGRDERPMDLFLSELKNGKWQTPVKMPSPVNSPFWDAQPTLSGDGNTLIFASTRTGTKGKEDLWITYKDASGKWSAPENLGDSINTTFSEFGAFFHPDGQSLYFVSDGHPGMGGSDLYFCRRLGKNKWSKPQNLGFPINTKRNEGPLTISLNGKIAYFSANYDTKSGNTPSLGALDLYSFELPESIRPLPVTYVQVNVVDGNTNQPLEATITLNHAEKEDKISAPLQEGSYWTALQLGERYSLTINKEGYLFYSDYFDLKESWNSVKPYILTVKLFPVSTEKAPPIILKNIFFNTASAELLRSSDEELNRLKDLLLQNPNLHIQINGHTDNVGDAAYNQRLSESRAKAVYDYLIQKQISPNRLKYKGFGASQPIADNSTPQGRSQNRRTEFEVVK